jgi:NAD(P)-dependent dehydrogenase (short-subunit alcohol dehydrogenase family)
MKNIIITGAAGNLGHAVTAEFAKGAYHMNVSVQKQIENRENQTAWYPDLTDAVAVEEMIKAISASQGRIQAAIHLVGGYKPGSLQETGLQDVAEMIGLNFSTAFNLVHALLPHYREQGGGKFVFIGAKAAMSPSTAGYNVAYALSKQMLVPFAELINAAHGADNISAHILLPGTLDTALNRKMMPDADFTSWTSTSILAETIRNIVDGNESRTIVQF